MNKEAIEQLYQAYVQQGLLDSEAVSLEAFSSMNYDQAQQVYKAGVEKQLFNVPFDSFSSIFGLEKPIEEPKKKDDTVSPSMDGSLESPEIDDETAKFETDKALVDYIKQQKAAYQNSLDEYKSLRGDLTQEQARLIQKKNSDPTFDATQGYEELNKKISKSETMKIDLDRQKDFLDTELDMAYKTSADAMREAFGGDGTMLEGLAAAFLENNIEAGWASTAIDMGTWLLPNYGMSENDYKRLKDKGMTDAQILDKARKDIKKEFIPKIKNSLKDVLGIDIDDYKRQEFREKSLIYEGLEGMAGSLRAMMGGKHQRIAQFALLGINALDEETLNDPTFNEVSETEKYKFKAPIALVAGILENIGFRNMMGKSPALLKFITKNVMGKAATNATVKDFETLVGKEITNLYARYGVRVFTAAAGEFETGALQELTEVGIKEIYDASKEKDLFKNPDILSKEMFNQTVKAGVLEAIGGFAMGSVANVNRTVQEGKQVRELNELFDTVDKIALNPKIIKALRAQQKILLDAGDITQEQYDDNIKGIDNVSSISSKIPQDISQEDRRKAFDLIVEKQGLEKKVAGLDYAMGQTIRDRVNQINEELVEISKRVVEKAPETTTETKTTTEEEVDTETETTTETPDIDTKVTEEEEEEEVLVDEQYIDEDGNEVFIYVDGVGRLIKDAPEGQTVFDTREEFEEERQRLKDLQTTEEVVEEEAEEVVEEEAEGVVDEEVKEVEGTSDKDAETLEWALNTKFKGTDVAIAPPLVVDTGDKVIYQYFDQSEEAGSNDVKYSLEFKKNKDGSLSKKGVKLVEDTVALFPTTKTEQVAEETKKPSANKKAESAKKTTPQREQGLDRTGQLKDADHNKLTGLFNALQEAETDAESTSSKGAQENLRKAKDRFVREARKMGLDSDMREVWVDALVIEQKAALAKLTPKPETKKKVTSQEKAQAKEEAKKAQLEEDIKRAKEESEDAERRLEEVNEEIQNEKDNLKIAKEEYTKQTEKLKKELETLKTELEVASKPDAEEGWAERTKEKIKKNKERQVEEKNKLQEEKERVADAIEYYKQELPSVRSEAKKSANKLKKLRDKKQGPKKSKESKGVSQLRQAFKTTPSINTVEEKIAIDEQAEAARESIKDLYPDLVIKTYYSDSAYYKAIGETDGSRGTYSQRDNVIHINLSNATKSTVAHEVFHAILFNQFGSNENIRKAVGEMVGVLQRSNNKNIVKAVRAVTERADYNKEDINEEIASEIFGILSGNYQKLQPAQKSKVRQILNKIAKVLRLRQFNDSEVIDLLNTLSDKVSKGESITVQDVNILEQEPNTGGSVGVFKFVNKKSLKAPSVKDDTRPFASLIQDVDIREFADRPFVTNMYDYTTAGNVDLGNGLSFELFGGKNYPAYMMHKKGLKIGDKSNLAAFNTRTNTEIFMRNVEKGEATLFAPHAGTLQGSWQFQHKIFLHVTDLILDNEILTNEELIQTFNEGLINKEGVLIEPVRKFIANTGLDISNFDQFIDNPKQLISLLDAETNASPDLRKRLSDKIISNNKFKKALGLNKKEDFYNKIIDPLNVGVQGGELMNIVEFDPNTFEIQKTKVGDIDHHESFRYTLLAKIKGIYQPTEFYKSYDVTDSYTKYNANETIVSTKDQPRFVESNVSSSAGAIPKVAKFTNLDKKQKEQRPDIDTVREFAIKNGIPKEDVDTFLKENGYTEQEISSSQKKRKSTKLREDSEQDIKNRKKKRSFREITRNIRTLFLDRQTSIKDLLNRIGTKESLRAVTQIVNKAGATGYGDFRFKEADKKIYDKLSDSDIDILNELVYIKRIISINENRRDRGMKPYVGKDNYNEKDARADLKDMQMTIGNFSDLSRRADIYFSEMAKSLKMLRDAQLISEEVYQNLKDVEYSPIKTIKYIVPKGTSDSEISRIAEMTGMNKDMIQNLSDENKNDVIMESRWLLQANISMVSAVTFENKMLNRFYEGIKSASPETKQLLEEYVLDNPVVGKFKNGKLKYKYDGQDVPGYTKVSFIRDGQPMYMVMQTQYANALLDIKKDMKALSEIGKWTMTGVLRFFATGGNPLFIVGNTSVDFQNILFLSDVYSNNKFKGAFNLTKDAIKFFSQKVLFDLTGKGSFNDTYREYMEYGGGMSYLSRDGLKSLEKLNPISKWKKIGLNWMKGYGNAMSWLGETSEISFRVSVYEKSKENQIKKYKKDNGIEPKGEALDIIKENAVREARETIDFSQGGSVVKQLDKALPYLNAATQGFRKAFDYATANPVKFGSSMVQMMAFTGALTSFSMYLLISAMDDDDDLEEILNSISDYEKANYHIVFTGEKDEKGEWIYKRFKKLPTTAVFTTLAEKTVMNRILKSKGYESSYTKEDLAKSLNMALPIAIDSKFAKNVVSRNPLLSALITYETNYDLFYDKEVFRAPRGKDIHPTAEGLYDDRVDEIYKSIAPALGFSPARSKAFVEKIITSESTNPTIGLIYAGFEAYAKEDKTLKGELANVINRLGESAGRKVTRTTNKNLISFNKMAEEKTQKMIIETDIWKSEQKVYKEIRKKVEAGEYFDQNEFNQMLLENFETRDFKKYYKKYTTYLKNVNLDRKILDVIYEDTPEVQALMLYNRFGTNLEADELQLLNQVGKAAGRKVSKKAYAIYFSEYMGK